MANVTTWGESRTRRTPRVRTDGSRSFTRATFPSGRSAVPRPPMAGGIGSSWPQTTLLRPAGSAGHGPVVRVSMVSSPTAIATVRSSRQSSSICGWTLAEATRTRGCGSTAPCATRLRPRRCDRPGGHRIAERRVAKVRRRRVAASMRSATADRSSDGRRRRPST